MGDFEIEAGERHYVRGEGRSAGRHIRPWSVRSAPAGFGDTLGHVEDSKTALIEWIGRKIAVPAATEEAVARELEPVFARLAELEEVVRKLADQKPCPLYQLLDAH